MYHSDSMMDGMWLTDSISSHPWGSSTVFMLRSYTWDDFQPVSGGRSPWECWPIPVAYRSALTGGTGWQVLNALEESNIKGESIKDSLAWLHYRNAYSVVNDLTKSNLDFFERRKKLLSMCNLFNSKMVAPVGLKCKIISIPIKFKLVTMLDVAFQVINKLRNYVFWI